MSFTPLPEPPNPVYYTTPIQGIDQNSYNNAVYKWMQALKANLDITLKGAVRPAGQPITLLSSFTTNTTPSSPSYGTGMFTSTTTATTTTTGTVTNTVTSTFYTGTTTSTDLANAVCSIVAAFTMRGLLTPTKGQ